MSTEILLGVALEAAVPIRIAELKRLPDWAFDHAFDRANLERLAQTVAEKGDILQFRSKKPGESAAVFNAVADALALLSFAPGGVTIFGRTWTATR